MKICSFKTITGDEIVCELVSTGTDSFTFKNLYGIQVTGVDPATGALQVRLLPFVVIEPDGNREVYKHAMMTAPCDVPSGVEKLFIQQTSQLQLIQP